MKFWTVVALLVAFTLGIVVDMAVNQATPVCHSVTEDGPITDCEYRDGGWYQK